MADDPYGNKGAQADPCWQDRIRPWGADAHAERMYLAGGWAFLNDTQVHAVLQGQPPPDTGWDDPPYSLDMAEGAWARWTYERELGLLRPRVTPNELAAWCDRHRFALNEMFVMGVQDFYEHRKQPVEQAAEPVKLAPWIVLPTSSPPLVPPAPKKRGRKATSTAVNKAAVAQANRLYAIYAKAGQVPSQERIAKEIAALPEFAGKSQVSILRAITGQVNQNKFKAMAASTKARPKR